MNIKKSLVSILLAFVVSNVLTTIWYMLMDEANYVPYRREEVNYGALVLNHLIYAGLMVYLFPSHYQLRRTKGRAFLFGMVVALLMFLPQAMVVRAIWQVDFNGIFILNTLAHTAIGGLMGVVVSMVYDYKNDKL